MWKSIATPACSSSGIQRDQVLKHFWGWTATLANLPWPLFFKEGKFLPLAKGGQEGFFDAIRDRIYEKDH